MQYFYCIFDANRHAMVNLQQSLEKSHRENRKTADNSAAFVGDCPSHYSTNSGLSKGCTGGNRPRHSDNLLFKSFDLCLPNPPIPSKPKKASQNQPILRPHPFRAPAVNPDMNCLDIVRYIIKRGILAMTIPAKSKLQSVMYCPKNSVMPSGIVFNLSVWM